MAAVLLPAKTRNRGTCANELGHPQAGSESQSQPAHQHHVPTPLGQQDQSTGHKQPEQATLTPQNVSGVRSCRQEAGPLVHQCEHQHPSLGVEQNRIAKRAPRDDTRATER